MAKKYIDAEELKDNIKALWNWDTLDGITATTVLMQTLRDIDNMPAADVVEVRHYLSEWCTDCKEYDKEKHCCPRFNRVIEETVAEMKSEGWQKVRHGHWEKRWNTWFKCELPTCSVCGNGEIFKTDYCPECGAKMVNEDG